MAPLYKHLRWPLRALKSGLGGLLALVILFEEWGWEPLQRVLARIGQLPGLRWVERRVARLSPYAALGVFVLPSVLLLPIKLLALTLISRGWVLGGALVIVVAKLLGTAVVARLFTLTQPALMTLPWFARLYGRWSAWKAALLARVRTSPPWRLAQRLRAQWLRRWRTWKARTKP